MNMTMKNQRVNRVWMLLVNAQYRYTTEKSIANMIDRDLIRTALPS